MQQQPLFHCFEYILVVVVLVAAVSASKILVCDGDEKQNVI